MTVYYVVYYMYMYNIGGLHIGLDTLCTYIRSYYVLAGKSGSVVMKKLAGPDFRQKKSEISLFAFF